MRTRPPLDGLDLNLLVVLDAVLRAESVTRAADALGSTQPSVSRALARLRRAFDDPLLVPSGRGMVATPLGAALRSPVARILADLDQLRDAADFEPFTTPRRFRALIPDVIAVATVPPLARALARAAPLARLSVLGSERGALPQLLSGDVELVVGAPMMDHPELVSRTLAHDIPWGVACGPEHPSWSSGRMDLEIWCRSRHVQLIPGEGPEGPSQLDRALTAQGLTRDVALQVAQLGTWGEVVRETSLIGTLPTPTLAALAASGAIRTFPHPLGAAIGPLSLRATWHARHQTDAGHRWFRGQLHAVVETGVLASP